MGMYNEVFAPCPFEDCHGRGMAQIGQIVFGFGGFSLDDPDELAEKLTEDELRELANRVEDATFRCQQCECYFRWRQTEQMEKRRQLARELFGR